MDSRLLLSSKKNLVRETKRFSKGLVFSFLHFLLHLVFGSWEVCTGDIIINNGRVAHFLTGGVDRWLVLPSWAPWPWVSPWSWRGILWVARRGSPCPLLSLWLGESSLMVLGTEHHGWRIEWTQYSSVVWCLTYQDHAPAQMVIGRSLPENNMHVQFCTWVISSDVVISTLYPNKICSNLFKTVNANYQSLNFLYNAVSHGSGHKLFEYCNALMAMVFLYIKKGAMGCTYTPDGHPIYVPRYHYQHHDPCLELLWILDSKVSVNLIVESWIRDSNFPSLDRLIMSTSQAMY
jgi:hypothetical protein